MKIKAKIGFIVLSFISLIITSCSPSLNVIYETGDVEKLSLDEILEYDNYQKESDGLLSFSSKVTSSVVDRFDEESKNLAFSPISLYFGLGLISVLASNESRDEILTALGIDYDELLEFIPYLYRYLYKDNDNCKVLLDNSFWIENDETYKDEVFKTLAERFYASSYKVDFSNNNSQANQALENYIDEKTNHLLKPKLNYDTDTLFVLMNILYFKNPWFMDNIELKSDGIHSFKNSDGSISDIELFKTDYSDGQVYEGENYKTFFANTLSDYHLQFIVPNDDLTIPEIFNKSIIEEVARISDYHSVDDANKISYKTRVIFPEFKAEFSKDLVALLREDFNINRIFEDQVADFSNSFNSNRSVYIRSINQHVKLNVDKKGIEGAAVTVADGATGTGPDIPYEVVYQDFIVDRNFIYFIKDDMNNILFSGVVNRV